MGESVCQGTGQGEEADAPLLPDTRGAVKNAPAAEDSPRVLPPRVLLIEPDMGVGRMILLALRSAGFDPIHARTGPEAFKALDQADVDAVVLDLEMPDGVGDLLLSRLRQPECRGGPALPWVALSAQEVGELIALYGPIGDRFVSKPFDPWHLVRILREAMGQSG